MNKIFKIVILVLIVFLATLGGILLFESANDNNPIASSVAVDDNNTNLTNGTSRKYYSNTTFVYLVKFDLTKNNITNKTVVKYYTRPSYSNSSYYYTTRPGTYNNTYYYYTTTPRRTTYTYTYYVYV